MKVKLLWVFLIAIIFLSGCQGLTKEEILAKTQRKFEEINTYQCRVDAEIIGNKGSQVYEMQQFYKEGTFRLETLSPKNLEGKVVIIQGSKGKIYHPNIDQSIVIEDFAKNESEEKFLGDFLLWDLQEGIKIEEGSVGEQEYLIVSKEADPKDYYHYRKGMWIDKETLLPKYIKIFDQKDNVRVELTISDLKINQDIDDELFKLE